MKLSDVSTQLSAPFPADVIKWRVGATNNRDNPTKGIALAYIDARHVFNRLDEVVGPENWETRIEETASGRVLCALTVCGVTKTDGAGSTNMEGEKGGISDAIKRAAVQFGVGRYLYDLPNQWVPVEKRGRSVYLKGSPPPLPQWAIPDGDTGQTSTEPGPPADDDEKEKFLGAVQDVLESMFAALRIDKGLTEEDALDERASYVEDILMGMKASNGKSYAEVEDIEDRADRKTFYLALKTALKGITEEGAA